MNNNVNFDSGLRIRGPFKLDIRNGCSFHKGNNFNLFGELILNILGTNIKSMICVERGAQLLDGINLSMNSVSILAKKSIQIGGNVKVGAGVIIMDSDRHFLDYKLMRDYKTDFVNAISREILIKNDTFISINSIITKGLIIGEKSIIADGSVVAKPIPNDKIWGGKPAKFIKK